MGKIIQRKRGKNEGWTDRREEGWKAVREVGRKRSR
jgi:hypothetical protein